MPLELVAGWTGVLDFVLKIDGIPAVLSSDDVVSMILRDSNRRQISTTGEVAILSATDGTVRYIPSNCDFVITRAPYYARFQVIDIAGRKVFFPSGQAETITVYPA